MIETGKDVPHHVDEAVPEAGYENQDARYANEAVTRGNQRAAEVSGPFRLDQCASHLACGMRCLSIMLGQRPANSIFV